jgi:hypothetical protein
MPLHHWAALDGARLAADGARPGRGGQRVVVVRLLEQEGEKGAREVGDVAILPLQAEGRNRRATT